MFLSHYDNFETNNEITTDQVRNFIISAIYWNPGNILLAP